MVLATNTEQHPDKIVRSSPLAARNRGVQVASVWVGRHVRVALLFGVLGLMACCKEVTVSKGGGLNLHPQP